MVHGLARRRKTPMRGWLGLAVVSATVLMAQPAFAARVEVQDGRLTVAADPAERLAVGVLWGSVTSYSVGALWTRPPERRTVLVAGDGCTQGNERVRGELVSSTHVVTCPKAGVEAITATGGDLDDSIIAGAPVPTILSGGRGADELSVDLSNEGSNVVVPGPSSTVTVLGGPGDDTIRMNAPAESAPVTVLGGPGDDTLTMAAPTGSVLDAGEGDDTVTLFGGAGAVDCGPGADSITPPTNHEPGGERTLARWAVNPASCPSLLRGLLSQREPPTVRLGRDGRLSVALFRSSEAVTGTIKLKKAVMRKRSRRITLVPLGRPTRITVPAGGVVRERRLFPAALRKRDTRTIVNADIEVRDSAGEPTVRRFVQFLVRPARGG